MSKKLKVNKLVKMSLLAGISAVLMMFSISIIPIFPWLKIDLADIPALIGAFAFGPLAGVIITIIKLALNLILTGTQTAGVGELANFLIGISMIVPASFIYHRNKTKKNAIIGIIVGAVSLQLIAIFANVYLLLPLYGITPEGGTMNYIIAGLLPFNILKAVIVGVVTFLLYKKISVAVFKEDAFRTKKEPVTN
ncbi:MAG: ECF transporter S component [Clostridium sp.]